VAISPIDRVLLKFTPFLSEAFGQRAFEFATNVSEPSVAKACQSNSKGRLVFVTKQAT